MDATIPTARRDADDSLVLDIGGDIGALVIHTGPEWAETEIEISPGPPRPGAARSHNVVHARHKRHGVQHSAVFPQLRSGDYTVWLDGTTAHGTVAIRGGHVTDYHIQEANPQR